MSVFSAAARPRLGRGVRLRRDRLSGKTLLLRPEQGFELQGAALEVVRLCSGELTVAEIVDRLAGAHLDAPREGIADDVERLLGELGHRGLIVDQAGGALGGVDDHGHEDARSSGAAPAATELALAPSPAERPYTLVAELTYRCPLRCGYCSNPVELAALGAELDLSTWTRVFAEAEALGVMQVTLTGGEPLVRTDLEEVVQAAHARDLYTTLITSGIPLERDRLARLRDAGLDGVQLSFQDVDAAAAARMAGLEAQDRKRQVAGWIKAAGLPLTMNVVLHRENLPRLDDLIALAEELEVDRLELAHVQYLGWALINRAALLPTAQMIADARTTVAAARNRLGGRMEILAVLPDYFSGRPRACMDGWGRRYLVIAPDGRVLPCHAAHTLPGLTFDNVTTRELAEIWHRGEAFSRFRGEAWMPNPCRTCEHRQTDFGGCRCQAFELTGDMIATDPSCSLAPRHDLVRTARAAAEEATTRGTSAEPALIRLRRPPTIVRD